MGLQPWQSSPIDHFLNYFATLPPKTYVILSIWGLLSYLNILSLRFSVLLDVFESCRNSCVAFSTWRRKLFRTFFRNWLGDLGHILPRWLIASCVDWGWGSHCFWRQGACSYHYRALHYKLLFSKRWKHDESTVCDSNYSMNQRPWGTYHASTCIALYKAFWNLFSGRIRYPCFYK